MDLFSLASAAEKYDISQWTVRRLIKTGQLRGYRIGRQIRIRGDDLEAALKPIPPASGGNGEVA